MYRREKSYIHRNKYSRKLSQITGILVVVGIIEWLVYGRITQTPPISLFLILLLPIFSLIYFFLWLISIVIGQYYFHFFKPYLCKLKINSSKNPYPEWNYENLIEMAENRFCLAQMAYSQQDTSSIDHFITNEYSETLEHDFAFQKRRGIFHQIEDIKITKSYIVNYKVNSKNKAITIHILIFGSKKIGIQKTESQHSSNTKQKSFKTVVKLYYIDNEWYIVKIKNNPLGYDLIY